MRITRVRIQFNKRLQQPHLQLLNQLLRLKLLKLQNLRRMPLVFGTLSVLKDVKMGQDQQLLVRIAEKLWFTIRDITLLQTPNSKGSEFR